MENWWDGKHKTPPSPKKTSRPKSYSCSSKQLLKCFKAQQREGEAPAGGLAHSSPAFWGTQRRDPELSNEKVFIEGRCYQLLLA